MSRQQWDIERHTRFYCVSMYRKLGRVLIYSSLLNVFLVLAASYLYTHHPARTYYASSGELPPVRLHALSHANHSSTPLEPREVMKIEPVKQIPE